MKTTDAIQREEVRLAITPGKAKRMGKQVTLRSDWGEIKERVMEYGLRKKFDIPYLRKLLLDIKGVKLIEGNTWGDRTWGAVHNGQNWEGKNLLGNMLMKIQTDLLE